MIPLHGISYLNQKNYNDAPKLFTQVCVIHY
jgi:hypothetical protein